MTSVRYRDLIDAPVISSDAFVLGDVEGIRYDSNDWRAQHLLISVKKGLMSHLGAGKSILASSRVLVPIDLINAGRQAFILGHPLEELKDLVKPENTNIPNLSNLLGKKVVSEDNQSLGTLYDLEMQPGGVWPISSLVIRLDKTMSEPLGIKKPLLTRMPDISLDILTIRNITELVQLDRDIPAIRDCMTVEE